MERFSLRSGDITIEGRVYRARGACGQQIAPAIVLSHEFGLSMKSTSRYARGLSKAGYHVFVFDFPGSGVGKSRGRNSTQMSVLTEVEDLGLVFRHVQSLPFVDRHRIVLAGASQGGLVSALLAAKHGDEVYRLVLYYPAFNIPDDARRGCMLGRQIDPRNVPKKFRVIGYVNLGSKYVRDAASLDPWKQIEGYRKPVLICHGAKDGIVDIGYSRKAASVYANAELVEFPRAHHVFAMPWTWKKAVRVTLNFLQAAQ